jgi:hypothetical protein
MFGAVGGFALRLSGVNRGDGRYPGASVDQVVTFGAE